MADSKISALDNLTSADPANDMIPIVDVSATPPASGNTKRISINNLLACSPSATLASATISGDLTVATNRLSVSSTGVQIGTTTNKTTAFTGNGTGLTIGAALAPTIALWDTTNASYVGSISQIDADMYLTNTAVGQMVFSTDNTSRYSISSTGVATWSNVGGVAGTAMTLNATGLGVGSGPGLTGGSRRTLTVNAPTGQLSILELGINGSIAGYLFSNATQTTLAAVGATFFSVETNAVERLRVDASGNLLVGTTTNTNASRVFSRGTATNSALALQGASGDVAVAQLTVGKFDNNTTTSQIFVRFTINDNSGGSGQINANGASQAAFGSFSDSRLKENIVSLPSQLANILSLRPVEFDYKDGSGHQIGFVAQEMQEVYSDAVGEQNGFLTVTGWSKTEARLVSAIKELAAKVQALEAKLA